MASPLAPMTATELSFGGRLHYDVAQFDDEVTPLANDNDIRRLRLSLSGKFLDDWRFKMERDVGGTSDGWKNVWLGYSGIQYWNFKAGNMTAPVGMEQTYGSNDMPLMERSLSAALAPGFLTGAQARYDRRGWTAALGYFTDPIDQELGDAGAEGDGFAGRVTYAPLRKAGKVLHFGTSYQRRSIDDTFDPVTNPDDGFRLRARPGSGLADRTLVATGIIPGVDGTSTWGVEVCPSWLNGCRCGSIGWTSSAWISAAGTRRRLGRSPGSPAATSREAACWVGSGRTANGVPSSWRCATTSWTWTTRTSWVGRRRTSPTVSTGIWAATSA